MNSTLVMRVDSIQQECNKSFDLSNQSQPSPPGRRFGRWIVLGVVVLVVLGVLLIGKGRGWKTKVLASVGLATIHPPTPASFVVTDPIDGAVDVPADGILSVRIRKGRELDSTTISPDTVHLVRAANQTQVEASYRLGAAQEIVVQPVQPLLPREEYAVYVTPRVKTTDGLPVAAFVTSFTTAGPTDPDLVFEKVELPTTKDVALTCVNFAPDGTLWAASVDGRIFQFPVEADGTLGTPRVIASLVEHEKGPRLLTGFAFEPGKGTSSIVVSHSFFAFENAPDFSSKVSRLSGPKLETVQDLVVNLPRSSGDHTTNQPVFGPDGALYIPQPSNTASGDPDSFWQFRPEHPLNATILRLDLNKLAIGETIDAKEPHEALAIYAHGVRLSYDLLWHSNGRLYSAVNGSSAGGNTPFDPEQPGSRVTGLTVAENDWLIDVKRGAYYGHANPSTNHLVLNGGNPTPRFDVGEVPEYPVGTRPDSNYHPPLLTLGQHISANGMHEYKGPACNGKLDRRILICRYSRGSDILVVTVDDAGRLIRQDFGLPGLRDFQQPLDVTQDPRTGFLYVSEFGAKKLTLVRPMK
jgi:Bacterial Ig-like domain